MGFDAIIRNGTVVTATDSYVADVAVIDGKIAAIGKDLPAENACAYFGCIGKDCYCLAASTCTRIWTCRSEARPARMTSKPARVLQHLAARRR